MTLCFCIPPRVLLPCLRSVLLRIRIPVLTWSMPSTLPLRSFVFHHIYHLTYHTRTFRSLALSSRAGFWLSTTYSYLFILHTSRSTPLYR
ncbi:hypothetical protein JAAARDRAFT_218601 [Jaapia argillacea MUCL 33604]|uniref:Uncharacterized protein n=1 Tax=Jaapia argillacea MUCL 33604 TaxID=933084 RepID=A0A067QKZ0_9AGAM|nr:hypothetical protein JAAARDRAFT_218601 [Jaapia argillacea MUCL 33604]